MVGPSCRTSSTGSTGRRELAPTEVMAPGWASDPASTGSDAADPWKDISKHERLIPSKGFALAKTRRSAHKDAGDIIVTFDDGPLRRRGI